MSYTRTQLETQTLEMMDAAGGSSPRWGTTLVRQTLSFVHARGWRRLLNANRSLRLATRTVTPSANGVILLADLDSGAGDSQERTYKVLGVAQGVIRFQPSEFMDDPLAVSQYPNALGYRFYRTTDSIQLIPANATSTNVWVNHLPTQITALAGDDSVVAWPADYEPILTYEAGAFLAAKGAIENTVTQTLSALADDLWADLLADVARFTTDPLTIRAGDSAASWGGQ